jgi:PIN domain nuclease of toxin-antitoxin system
MGMVRRRTHRARQKVKLLLDTHFLIWLVLGSDRIGEFPWLGAYRPWGVSPIALLEIQFLSEIGRLTVKNPAFVDALSRDERFLVDEVPLAPLIRHALPLEWTRDPFDRLLSAHSLTRRLPLCTVDQGMMEHHRLIVEELR